MTIELTKKDDTIICKVPDQEETPLGELCLLMFFSDAQIKKVLGPTKPEWKINFQPSEKEKEDIDQLKSALDKVYSR